MATQEYKGHTFTKTGRASHDWHCCFGGRNRWGTLEELRGDADLIESGIGLPTPKENQ